MAQIPFTLEDFLMYIFPGLWLTVLIFMILDIVEPLFSLLEFVTRVSTLALFTLVLIILGYFFGVLVDTISHRLLSDRRKKWTLAVYKGFSWNKELLERLRSRFPEYAKRITEDIKDTDAGIISSVAVFARTYLYSNADTRVMAHIRGLWAKHDFLSSLLILMPPSLFIIPIWMGTSIPFKWMWLPVSVVVLLISYLLWKTVKNTYKTYVGAVFLFSRMIN